MLSIFPNNCSQNFRGDRHLHGSIVFRCSMTIPATTLSTLRRSTLPHPTQDSLPMPRLTAYWADVCNPLYEAPLAGRTDRHHCSSSFCVFTHTSNFIPFFYHIRFLRIENLFDNLTHTYAVAIVKRSAIIVLTTGLKKITLRTMLTTLITHG